MTTGSSRVTAACLTVCLPLACFPIAEAAAESPPAQPVVERIGEGEPGGEGAFRVRWESAPGERYLLEESSELTDWAPVPGFPATAGEGEMEHRFDPEAADGRRFFRLTRLPPIDAEAIEAALRGNLAPEGVVFPEPEQVGPEHEDLFENYFADPGRDRMRADIDGDGVVDDHDRALFEAALAGERDDVFVLPAPDGGVVFTRRLSAEEAIAPVLDTWLLPTLEAAGLAYDPGAAETYAALLEAHAPAFVYANLAGSGLARAVVFVSAPFDGNRPYPFPAADAPSFAPIAPAPVTLTNLGVYDEETGERIADHFDSSQNAYVLKGKYLETFSATGSPHLGRFSSVDPEDFSVDYRGDDEVDQASAIVWSSEANMYYHTNRYREDFLNEDFIQALNLSPEIESNFLTRQYRHEGFQGHEEDSLDVVPRLAVTESGISPSQIFAPANPTLPLS